MGPSGPIVPAGKPCRTHRKIQVVFGSLASPRAEFSGLVGKPLRLCANRDGSSAYLEVHTLGSALRRLLGSATVPGGLTPFASGGRAL